MTSNSFIIFGSGGHATSIISSLMREGCEIKGIFDPNSEAETLFGIPLINSLHSNLGDSKILIAIGDNYSRHLEYTRAVSRHGRDAIGNFVSRFAYVSHITQISAGCVILPNSYVGPNSYLGEGVLINTAAIVEHDCILGPFSSLAPNSTMAGGGSLGQFSHLGISAVQDAKVSIGDNSILGANSFLMRDLESNSVAIGNPARFLRFRNIGEKYLR